MKLITFICVTILSCESFVLAARTQSNTKVAQCSGSIAQQGDKEMRFNLEWSTDSDLSAVVLNLSSYINRSDWIGIKLLGDIDNIKEHVIIAGVDSNEKTYLSYTLADRITSKKFFETSTMPMDVYKKINNSWDSSKLNMQYFIDSMVTVQKVLAGKSFHSMNSPKQLVYKLLMEKEVDLQLSPKLCSSLVVLEHQKDRLYRRGIDQGLMMILPNVEISKHENKSILYPGAPLLLQCSWNLTDFSSFSPTVTNQWTKDNSIITNSSRTSQCIAVSSNIYVAELFIYSLNSTTDAGEYQCNMTVCGNDSECSNSISEALPVEISDLTPLSVDLELISTSSSLLLLQCNVSTDDQLIFIPKIEWFYSGSLLSTSSNTIESLEVSDPMPGTYTCQASVEVDEFMISFSKNASYILLPEVLPVTVSAMSEPTFGVEYKLVCIVNVSSNVSVNVNWFDGTGSPIQSSSSLHIANTVLPSYFNSTLTFSSLSFSNAGTYTCSAGISSLVESDNYTVQIQLPPIELGDITRDYYGILYSGTPLALTCSLNLSTIDTTFNVTSEWTHNEEVVSNTSRIKQCITEIANDVYNATLYFYPLNSTIDDGEYSCTFSIGSNLLLSNITSNASTYLSIEELGLPSVALNIINESRVQSVLQCTVTGMSSRLLVIPELQWFKEGELISSSFNTIENLGVPFSGLYRCAATLTISDINSTVASFATYDIIIQGTLRASVLVKGNQLFDDDLELVCTVNGSSFSNVSWYDPSGAQILDTSLIYVITNSEDDSVISVLKFSSLRFSDNGEYQCLAQLDSYIASESVNISVQLPKSLDIRITQDYTGQLYTGTPLTIRCSLNLTAIDANVTVYSQWISTSLNANIQTDSRLTQSLTEISANAYESVLTFNPLDSLVDDREYTCYFTVSIDDVVTEDRTGNASIQLSVNDAPPLFVNLALVNISSTEILLECSVTSVNRLIATPPILELVFSDAVLYTLTGSSSRVFRLDRVQTLSGVYRCNAEVTIVGLNVTVNGTGDNHLTIPDALDIELSVTDEPLLGSEYSLVCTANGSIIPIIQWYNENDELLNTSTVSVTTIAPALISVVSVLTFNPLRLSNGGHYRCSAVLANGNSTLVENDTVMVLIQLPSLPVLLSLDYDGLLYTGTPLLLSCSLNISFIETSVLIDTQWTINELDILSVNQSRVIQRNIEITDNVFKSSLEFNPLNSVTDNGEIVCSFTVSPSTGGEYFVNATTRAATNISVNALAYFGVDIALSSNETLATVQCITSTIDRLIVNPVLKWSYPSDALIVSSTSNNLTFNPLLTSSAGQYACTASISIDSINFIIQNSSTLNFTLQIPSPTVSITASPSMEVFHDTVLNLTCTAILSEHIDSPVEIIFEWFDFDDRITMETIISGNGSHFERSALIHPEQYSGSMIRNYTCNVTISSMSHYLTDGINSFTIPITVQELPSFTPSIESTGTPVFGEELILNCSVTLVNELRVEPTIYWQKIDSDTNETLMLSGQEYSRGLLKGIILTLSNLSFDSRGLYICGVEYVSPSSNMSEVTHENYTVTLEIPPVTAFILPESTNERIAGTFFELKCLLNTTFLDPFNSSLFPVSSQWLHNNSMVNSNRVTGRIDNDSNGFYRTTLAFYPLNTSDSGSYQCSLTVGIEDQYVQTTQLNTSTTLYIRNVPPLNVTITSSNERSLSRPYSLTCSAPLINGFISLPTLQWYNDDDDLLESSVGNVNGSLTVVLLES